MYKAVKAHGSFRKNTRSGGNILPDSSRCAYSDYGKRDSILFWFTGGKIDIDKGIEFIDQDIHIVRSNT